MSLKRKILFLTKEDCNQNTEAPKPLAKWVAIFPILLILASFGFMLGLNAAPLPIAMPLADSADKDFIEKLTLIENASVQSLRCPDLGEMCIVQWKSVEAFSDPMERTQKERTQVERPEFGYLQVSRRSRPFLENHPGLFDFMVLESRDGGDPVLRGWSLNSKTFRMEADHSWVFVKRISVQKINYDCLLAGCFWHIRPPAYRSPYPLKYQISTHLFESFHWVTRFGADLSRVPFVLRKDKSLGVGFAFDDGFEKRQTYYYDRRF